jgi:hypothetical protein
LALWSSRLVMTSGCLTRWWISFRNTSFHGVTPDLVLGGLPFRDLPGNADKATGSP